MSLVLAISAACMTTALTLAAGWWWARKPARPVPGRQAAEAARNPAHESVSARCVLCHAPLPFRFVTREEVIARVEHRIDDDAAAVAKLLAGSPSGAWAGSIRS
jgi:hypothetical protein